MHMVSQTERHPCSGAREGHCILVHVRMLEDHDVSGYLPISTGYKSGEVLTTVFQKADDDRDMVVAFFVGLEDRRQQCVEGWEAFLLCEHSRYDQLRD